jgi:hypothetical protein
MNSPETDALILRACQPKKGDRFMRSELFDLIIQAITPSAEFEAEVTCQWTTEGQVKTEAIHIGYYRLLAKRSIEVGHLFIPVEVKA